MIIGERIIGDGDSEVGEVGRDLLDSWDTPSGAFDVFNDLL
jgi:hypothetical protein